MAKFDLSLHFYGWLQTLCGISQLNLGWGVFYMLIMDKVNNCYVEVPMFEIVLAPFVEIHLLESLFLKLQKNNEQKLNLKTLCELKTFRNFKLLNLMLVDNSNQQLKIKELGIKT